jgi:sugar/nucleoside kinase (ribokinase family)
MTRALFVGEINVDVMMGGMASPPVIDREVPCESYEVVMGGSTIITACAYAALGGPAVYAGLAGEDDYGAFMLKGLAEFGVDTSLVRHTRTVKTGVTVNLIYKNTRSQVTYPGAIEAYDGAGLDAVSLAGLAHVHFGGVYLEHGLRPRIAEILRTAAALGATTSLDPQWDSAERWEFMDQWLPLLTWLFVNSDEAVSITGAASAEEALTQLAGRTRCPLVKVGKDGALAWMNGEVVPVRGREVAVVDTTGAGDSFDAGFLYATLERQQPLLEAVRFANAVAARSCLFTGGTAARSSCRDIEAFLAR